MPRDPRKVDRRRRLFFPRARDLSDRVEALESALEKLAETGWAAEGLSKEQLEVTREVHTTCRATTAVAKACPSPVLFSLFRRKFRLDIRNPAGCPSTPGYKHCGGNGKSPTRAVFARFRSCGPA